MAEFRFYINNYHAINTAVIDIDGITVLAGPNGCGKSTVARWLYAFVKYSNEFDRIIDKRFINDINSLIRKLAKVARNFDNDLDSVVTQLKSIPESFIDEQNDSLFADSSDCYLDIIDIFTNKVNAFCSALSRQLDRTDSADLRNWIIRSLSPEKTDIDGFTDYYKETVLTLAESYAHDAVETKRKRSLSDLYDIIDSELESEDSLPKEFNLNEGGLDLISSDAFRAPFGLSNAIYVDTPMALSKFLTFDATIWDKLKEAMVVPFGPMPASAKKTAARLRRIMGGNVMTGDDGLGNVTELRFIRKEDGLDIPIYEVATGVKTFAYMLRLLENGYLNENSILLIDEPEAHLHPQWIVEFARVLILLNKEVGTKILIASHNPDMIAAIKSIAMAHDRTDYVRFYQAVADKMSLRYSFKDLGSDVDEIFQSFNIALERIKDYGV